MKRTLFSNALVRGLILFSVILSLVMPAAAGAPDNATAQALPFGQDWTDTGLITVDDNWDNVPGIMGYRGDGLTGATGTDPQTILADGTTTPVNVNANQTNPNTYTTGGVTEFHITNPVVALTGSNTADAPFILISINTIGLTNIQVSYNLRDIDGSTRRRDPAGGAALSPGQQRQLCQRASCFRGRCRYRAEPGHPGHTGRCDPAHGVRQPGPGAGPGHDNQRRRQRRVGGCGRYLDYRHRHLRLRPLRLRHHPAQWGVERVAAGQPDCQL